MRDVAWVHDGNLPQTNLVRRDGRPSALLPILTSGTASTLSVVDAVRKLMPRIQAGLPKSLDVAYLFDQSVFVRASISGVQREGAIAAGLTAIMILLFLGSWRSTLIVATSIPLSILASIAVLHVLGQTLNVMTLGGMALAVGILVDDATVEIENNHRHIALESAFEDHASVDQARMRIEEALRARAQLRAQPRIHCQPIRAVAHAQELQILDSVLRQQLRGRCLGYTDAQRRRLATAAKKLGRKALRQLDTLVTPDTLLR